jgi:uncharacterized protein
MKKLIFICGYAIAVSASLSNPVLANPAAAQVSEVKAATVTAEQFKKFEGQYQLAPGFVISILQKDGKFQAQATGQDSFEIFADSATSFYAKVADIKISFVLGADGVVSSFIFSQNGRAMPPAPRIVGAKAVAPAAPKRPQEEAIEKSGLPYSSSDVSFTNTKANIALAGTLTLPEGKGPFPAVVLVHGSGPHDRNANVQNHKIFLVLADHLSKQGIAVLRYDKRGIGASKGDYRSATSLDFADDAQAASEYLRTRPEIIPGKIGLVGHSEGGLIAPIVAARDDKLGFIVMMAAPGVRGDKILLEQSRLISQANGESKEEIAKSDEISRQAFAIVTGNDDAAIIKEKLSALFEGAEKSGAIPKGAGKGQMAMLASPWFKTFLGYDPAANLAGVKQAALVLNGELDLQVPSKMNLDAIRASMKGNPKVVFKEFPKLNHLLQTATTGSPAEYGKIEETMSPAVLATVAQWVRQQ